MEDTAIIDLYWARDPAAIQETEDKYGRKLRGLAGKMIRQEDAEECVNDTYLAAWNNIPPVRPVHFFAWLAKVCRNRVCSRIEWYRAGRRGGASGAEWISLEEELSLCTPGNPTEEALDEKELGRMLSDFLRELDREKRILFLRRYWFGDSVADIARLMGITESNVKVTLHRIRKRLKDSLEKEGVRV